MLSKSAISPDRFPAGLSDAVDEVNDSRTRSSR
jgi:hypothetical protein